MERIGKLRLKEGGHDRILLFDEVIDLIKPTLLGLRMEIKVGADDVPYPGIEAMLAERLEALDAEDAQAARDLEEAIDEYQSRQD